MKIPPPMERSPYTGPHYPLYCVASISSREGVSARWACPGLSMRAEVALHEIDEEPTAHVNAVL